MVKSLRAIFGISWFWFLSATVLSLYSPYGKSILHVRQSVVTLFLASFVLGMGFAYVLYKTLLKKLRENRLCALSSFGMSASLLALFFMGKPTFAHSFITLGIREFIHYSDGVYIIFYLGLLALSSGLFVIPLYKALQNFSTDSNRGVVTNNISNVLFIVLSAPFLYYLSLKKISISQTFLILALTNGIIGVFLVNGIKKKQLI